jgi:pimeloyl-ACP methyl ester carboxylesterase
MEYLVRGEGETIFVCFHGHGLNMHTYEFIPDIIPNSKVVSFNLFFHGNSELKEDNLHHENLHEIVSQILTEEGIEKFSVIGYSLGGKFALNMVNYFPMSIERVILIAPEGIKLNNFYNFSSRIWLARRAYKNAISNPAWFFSLARFLKKIKVFSPSMIKFIEIQMGEEKDRQMAYNTWAKFRYVFPNQGRLKRNLEVNNIDLVIMIGEKDRIIKPEMGSYFIRKMGRGEFRMLPITHDVFKSEYLEIIKREVKEIVL